jgi:hypothetical protein
MVNRTFTAAVDSSASNPNNWSPTGTPQPGDNLNWVDGGTMNVSGNVLAGDTLLIGSTSDTPPEDFVINVSDKARFTEQAVFPPQGIKSITINLADHSKWIGGFSSNLGGGVFITGDGKFANQTSLAAAKSVVDVPVVGHGAFTVSSAQSTPGELEFTKSVSKGQKVTVGGDPTRDVRATLTVDDPADYRARNTLGFGEITLADLTADSFSIKHDILLLFSGSKVVERLALAVDPQLGARNFGVSQTMAGIVVHADNFNETGTPLPMH